ncbi:Protein trichome birefringence-like 14 [Fagus crenata]
MWACRLTQRKDFSFEGYRWQPENCEMPEFERSEFLRRMQDKTVAFIGDSLGRQQFQSLMCMATGGEQSPEVENVGKKMVLSKLVEPFVLMAGRLGLPVPENQYHHFILLVSKSE